MSPVMGDGRANEAFVYVGRRVLQSDWQDVDMTQPTWLYFKEFAHSKCVEQKSPAQDCRELFK